jgi:hypothetical protein
MGYLFALYIRVSSAEEAKKKNLTPASTEVFERFIVIRWLARWICNSFRSYPNLPGYPGRLTFSGNPGRPGTIANTPVSPDTRVD